MIELLHQGFDGLDLSIRTQLLPRYAPALEQARDRAIETRKPQLVDLAGIAMHVRASGGVGGGYRYWCDTGPLGAVWFFKKPDGRDDWGVRVSMRSLPLALYGIGKAYLEIERVTGALTGSFDPQGVAISRVDYALDYLLTDFQIVADQFVMHSRLTRTVNREISEIGRSGRVHAIRIGKMPGQQVAFYDKRADVIAKNKKIWWDIWNASRADNPISPENTHGKLWRIEFRAGKDHLRHREIRTWTQFQARGGGMFTDMAASIRYAKTSSDANRARWLTHPLWLEAQTRLQAGLMENTKDELTERFRDIARAEHIQTLDDQIFGCCASLAAALGMAHAAPPIAAALVTGRVANRIDAARSKFIDKMHLANERNYFISVE